MTDHQPPPAVEAIGRLENLARIFRDRAESARYDRDDHQAANDLEADAVAIDTVLESLRHSVEREAGLAADLKVIRDYKWPEVVGEQVTVSYGEYSGEPYENKFPIARETALGAFYSVQSIARAALGRRAGT